jgi:hypothetical protein
MIMPALSPEFPASPDLVILADPALRVVATADARDRGR